MMNYTVGSTAEVVTSNTNTTPPVSLKQQHVYDEQYSIICEMLHNSDLKIPYINLVL